MPDGLLIQVPREADLPDHMIPKGLRKVKETARCEFCNERVVYNRINVNTAKEKHGKVVLICMVCYGDGAHIRQGYRGVN